MPRKTKKSIEILPVEPEQATGLAAPDSQAADRVQEAQSEVAPEARTAPKKAARKRKVVQTPPEPTSQPGLVIEAESSPQAKSPGMPQSVAAEAMAHAADTLEDAIEANDAAEADGLAGGIEVDPAALDHDGEDGDDAQVPDRPQPPPKLERLQKILAAAGVASRRHAEELITEGRVQVNGKVITELGTKADAARDHIRVDGKLLRGAERLRYFVLNKPRGYVTTVSDPEGRPTVMEFFSKMNERLYPVGRLDYLSEGLLLVTNDGELANKLTRAASGVEKTYLVKVSGQPTENELETLRQGVSIDRGKPGEGRVQTAAARIRQVRVGENPWFEVVLIEGRNRELRKMFEEIGHFVEKIRRVGYGPLILDQEPGNLRELDPEELRLLRLAADGKWKPKRQKTTAMLPKEAGRTVDLDASKRRGGKPVPQDRRSDRPAPRQEWGQNAKPTGDRNREGDRPRPPGRGFERPASRERTREGGAGFAKPERGAGGRGSFSRPQGERPGSQKPFRGRPPVGGQERPRPERTGYITRPRPAGEGARPPESKPFRPRTERPMGAPPAGARFEKPRFTARPSKPADARPGSGAGRTGTGSGPARGFGRPSDRRSEGGTSPRPPRREGSSAPPRTGPRTSFGARPQSSTGRPPATTSSRPAGSGERRYSAPPRGRSNAGPRSGGKPPSRPGFKGKTGGNTGRRTGNSGRKRT